METPTGLPPRLAPLGFPRLRVLDCLGGSSPGSPNSFAVPPEGVSIFGAFRDYVTEQSKQRANESDPLAVSLLAAGRLLAGELSAADVILDHLPAQGFKLDRSAGACVIAPVYSFKAALPIPETLGDTRRWLQGTSEQAALRAWLAEKRDKLRWVESEGIYRDAGLT
jgi:hypothetical protein